MFVDILWSILCGIQFVCAMFAAGIGIVTCIGYVNRDKINAAIDWGRLVIAAYGWIVGALGVTIVLKLL